MNIIQFITTGICLLMLDLPLLAQVGVPGKLDTSFSFGLLPSQYYADPYNPSPGTGPTSGPMAVLMQPDSQILVSGDFPHYNGLVRRGITRLNPDGTNDSTFNPGNGATSNIIEIRTMALQPDGKILIAGNFTGFNGIAQGRIARLNPDGSLDTTFNVGAGANARVRAMALQSDGKVMIAGDFTAINGVLRNQLARLNDDGSLDTTFVVGTGTNGIIKQIWIQSDDRILIAGDFSQYNQTSSNQIARLLSDGALDSSFSSGSGLGGVASPILAYFTLQPDGRIIIGGTFETYNGVTKRNIVRLSQNGTIDPSFNTGTNVTTGLHVFWIAVKPNNQISVAGFTNNQNKLIQLLPNGSLDTAFNSFLMPGLIANLHLQASGDLLISGNFSTYHGISVPSLIRTDSIGRLDLTFNRPSGANGYIKALAHQPDGKLLIAGNFSNFNASFQNRVARLLPNGGIDTTFHVGAGPSSYVHALTLLPDSSILVGGNMQEFDGVPVRFLAKLHPNGRLDTTFRLGNNFSGLVTVITLQPNGKILIGGAFSIVRGITQRGIARLNLDGSLDTSFNVGVGTNSDVQTIALQSDGKILIGGFFSTFNGTTQNRIARLHPDGRLDSTFVIGTGGSGGAVRSIIVRPDGKIFAGGSFTSFNGTTRNRLVLLNSNGSIDPNYPTAFAANNVIRAMAYQPDGKLLLAGQFSSIFGVARFGIARLNANGTLDTTFKQGAGVRFGYLETVITIPRGRALIGGVFSGYDNFFMLNIAQIFTGNCVTTPTNLTTTDHVCPGGSKMLVGTPGSNWVIASGPGSIQGNIYQASADTGLVIVYNQSGDCLSSMVSFYVRWPNAPEVVDPAPICAGQQTTITPVNGGTVYRFYANSIGGSPLPGGNDVLSFTTPNLTTSTAYYVAAVNDSGCESALRQEVSVVVLPLPQIQIRQENDSLVGDSLLGTYQWYVNNFALVGDTNRILVPIQSGTYTLKFTDTLGCTNTSNAILVVIASTPDLSLSSFEWSTYPVPFEQQLTIAVDTSFTYELIDLRGMVVLKGATENQSALLETSSLASGMYLVKVVVNGQTALRKVMKK